MNTFVLAALSNANYHDEVHGEKVHITTKHAGGHKYKFDSKYFSVSEAFNHALKKDKPSNQCERVNKSIVTECPEDYVLVDDVRYPFCEFVTTEPIDLVCTGTSFEDECYGLDSSRVCPDGYFMDKKSHVCTRAEFREVEYVCPPAEEEYFVMDGKKGKYCEASIIECEFVCPSGSYRDPATGLCMEKIAEDPTCLDGFVLSDDMTYCFREEIRPCNKHDVEVAKHHGEKAHHLRRLNEKHDIEEKYADHKLKVDAHKMKDEIHKDSKYVKQMHSKAMPIMKEKEFHSAKDKYGVKAFESKVKKVHTKEHTKGKPSDWVQTQIIDRGLCTYQDISAPIPAYIDVEVPEVKECKTVIDMQPVERVCEDGFEMATQWHHKEPTCVKSDSTDLICPVGTTEIDKMCYVVIDSEKTCQMGFRLTDDGLFCAKSDVVPPKYQWLLARQCEGYKCIDYYENSCLFN
jgi:hypothetical protein